MEFIFEYLRSHYSFSLSLFIACTTLILLKKRRSLKKTSQTTHSNEINPIDYGLLEEAEKNVVTLDRRQELLKEHDMIQSFYSFHGYDDNFMYEQLKKLREAHISADFIFSICDSVRFLKFNIRM